MRRRTFVRLAGMMAPAILQSGQGIAAAAEPKQRERIPSEWNCDAVIVGGGLGGCAAALAAARNGLRVILTEETDWIGGQLTSQAVPPDEHRGIESHGCTRSYRAFRNGVRDYYRRHYPLTEAARKEATLNPGGGSVSRLCHEPRVALAVLYEMLAPHISNGRLVVLLQHRPIAAEVDGDRVRNVVVEELHTGVRRSLQAPWIIDATETGDLLPLTKTEYVTGFEGRSDTGEDHAPEQAQPANMQAITWCFPMEYVPGGNFVKDKPRDYDFWRGYVPKLSPAWPGRLLDFSYSHPVTLKPKTLAFDPEKEASGWWLYRRIVNKRNFRDGAYPGSVTLVNWPQNDYLEGNLFETAPEDVAKHREGARQLSLSLFYWMQTEAPRPDGGAGWPGLRLRPEIVGTTDGLAKYPYIRESRRIQAEFTVTERHVGADMRARELKTKAAEATATPFDDSVGIGSYRIDLHPSTGGDNYIDLASLPFQIPLGALLPKRVENLIAANKNIGTTHITNGCYRLHPVEWNIGEAAGALAAHCVKTKSVPKQVRSAKAKLADFQRFLESEGFELAWPKA